MSPETTRAAFRDQAQSCRMLGSPLTGRICDLLAEGLDTDQGAVARRVLDWPGDPHSRADSVPLRLCGALHALVLTGADPELALAYAAGQPTSGLLLQALIRHENAILGWLDNPPQTNEVGRAAAIIAAARFASQHYPLPIRALELGASAGLNQNFAHYRLDPRHDGQRDEDGGVTLRPDWTGPVPEDALSVDAAEGVDLRPVDPVRDSLRLLAYCWPDQDARMARLRAALQIARRHPPLVTAGDAASWLADRLAKPAPGRLTMVYHTIAWQYFPAATQTACESALQTAAAMATPAAPVAHFAMEADGGDKGAGLLLRLWDGTEQAWHLGRADFHGRWIEWQPTAL